MILKWSILYNEYFYFWYIKYFDANFFWHFYFCKILNAGLFLVTEYFYTVVLLLLPE